MGIQNVPNFVPRAEFFVERMWEHESLEIEVGSIISYFCFEFINEFPEPLSF